MLRMRAWTRCMKAWRTWILWGSGVELQMKWYWYDSIFVEKAAHVWEKHVISLMPACGIPTATILLDQTQMQATGWRTSCIRAFRVDPILSSTEGHDPSEGSGGRMMLVTSKWYAILGPNWWLQICGHLFESRLFQMIDWYYWYLMIIFLRL